MFLSETVRTVLVLFSFLMVKYFFNGRS